MLCSSLLEDQEAAAYLGSSEGTDSVAIGPSKSKTIHCLKQMIYKVEAGGEGRMRVLSTR